MEEPDVAPVIERIEDPAVLLTQIKECLSYRDARGLKTYVLEHKLNKQDIFWDLTSILCQQITQKVSEDDPIFFEACERCLNYLVANGNPKEMLLALLENVDFGEDGARFATMLPLVQRTLLALPSRRYHSLDLSLETITAYVLALPLPEDDQLEGQEKKLLLLDEDMRKYGDALEAYLGFLRPFVEEVSAELSAKGRKSVPQAMTLKRRLLQVLEKPLVYLELGHNSKERIPKSALRQCAEDVVAFLAKLETNFHEFLVQVLCHAKNASSSSGSGDRKADEDDNENDEDDAETDSPQEVKGKTEENMKTENEENESIVRRMEKMGKEDADRWNCEEPASEMAVACFSYLIHVEYVGKSSFPSVFSHSYMFEFNLPLIQVLLKFDHSVVVDKGLRLCQHFVSLIPPRSLTFLRLDNRDYFQLVHSLTSVMVRCPVRELRRFALDLMEPLFQRFETKGRYQLFESIFATCTHPGVAGYIIRMLKNEVHENLNSATPQDYFLGGALERLITLALQLPGEETADLLDQSDRIIAGINFLRYLLLREKPEHNVSGIWQRITQLTNEFISPLRKGLVLSKAHYKEDFRRMLSIQNEEGQGDVKVDVEIRGKKLPLKASKEELQFFYSAMNTFDMMDGLLTRLEEIIQTGQRSACPLSL